MWTRSWLIFKRVKDKSCLSVCDFFFFLMVHEESEESQQVMELVLEGPVSTWERFTCRDSPDLALSLFLTPHAAAITLRT